MKPKDSRPEYIRKNGILYQYIDERAYGGECYVAVSETYHYWDLGVK